MNEPPLAEIVQIGRIRLPLDRSLLSAPIVTGILRGWYEKDERRFVQAAVRDGDRVLDLGGGLGVCAATAAVSARIASVVIVEANPRLLDAIRLTMELNGIRNFELLWGAISIASAATTQLAVGEHFWAARETRSGGEENVSVPTLSPQAMVGRVHPDVLICDIEGNEETLIETADLSGVRDFIVELHPSVYGQKGARDLDARLAAGGFQRLSNWIPTEKPQVHHYTRK